MKPGIYVLPDVMNDAIRTRKESVDFLVRDIPRTHSKPMWVLQALPGDVFEFVHQYMSSEPHVGFPRCMRPFQHCDVPWVQRFALVRGLKKIGVWRKNGYHHALGWCDGELSDYKLLTQEGFDSADSTGPVWRGLLGVQIGQPWDNTPIHFNIPEATADTRTAQLNLEEVDRACQY